MAPLIGDAQFDEIIRQLLSVTSPEEAVRLLRESPWLASEEVDLALTRMIAVERRESDLWGMTSLMACRGLLRRWRSWGEIDKALAAQSGWPLYSQGPLNQLLALPGNASADERIRWATVASADVDPKREPDFHGLICYHLGWGHRIKADEGSSEALDQALAQFEVTEAAWQDEGSLFDRAFLAQVQDDLGRLYLQRRHGDRSQDIETALCWLQKAHKTFDREAPEQLDISMLMGKAYLSRIRGERLHNIEQGVACYEEAYHLAKRQDPDQRLGYIEHSLAVAHRLRLREHPADNYEQAKRLAEQALTRFDRRTPDWARTAVELATIYAHRQHGNRDENLEKAIEYAEQALAIYTPRDHPHQWTLAQLTLGNLSCDRVSGVRAENDDQAICCFEAILDRHGREADPLRWSEAMNNLGTVYATRSACRFDVDYRRATRCFRQALEVRKPETLPPQTRQTATNWGNLAFRFSRWAEAWEAFQIALKANETLYQVSSTEAGRRAELAEGAGLATRAAFCLLKLGHPSQAVEVLERGRTRIVGDILARDRAALVGIDSVDREAFEQARMRVRELEAEGRLADDEASRNFLEISADLSAARARLAQVVERIRVAAPNFMPAGLDISAVRAIVHPDKPLAYLLTTEHGSAAIVVPHQSPANSQKRVEELGEQHVVWLKDFHTAELSALLARQDEDGNLTGGLLSGQLLAKGLKAELDAALPVIRERLMAPLAKRLHGLGYIATSLVPTGQLSLLPLHAAVLDDLTSCFVPSAQVLGQVRRANALEVPMARLTLVGVGNPSSNGGSLPFAESELKEIVNLWPGPSRPLYGTQATLKEAKVMLSDAGVCHFACHGRFNLDYPLASGLRLSDDLLNLTALLDKGEVNLEKARLAVLSACQTALADFRDVPDEAIGLPAGFVVAGVPGVVGTLWSVYDASTALLMGRFYRKWLGDGGEPVELPEALRQAQIWLRDVTAGELANYFSTQNDAILDRLFSPWRPKQITDLYRRFASMEPDDRPFEHAVYWAAFTYTGV